MKGEESPEVCQRNMERDLKLLQQISCTPKGKNIGLDDLHLLGLHRDCSPNTYGSSQDKLEIGWGDSPEPLNIEQKARLYNTPVACKKRLDARESPKSRCRNLRASIRPLTSQPVDVSKYLAEIQALSKKIMNDMEDGNQRSPGEDSAEGKENAHNLDPPNNSDVLDLFGSDDLTNEYLIACSQSLESSLANGKGNFANRSIQKEKERERKSFAGISSSKQCTSENTRQQQQDVSENGTASGDSAFEKVLQSFIAEEDDWLSQVALTAEAKVTPKTNGFMKTKSENQLNAPSRSYKSEIPVARRSGGLNTTLRRTYSSSRVGSNDFTKNSAGVGGRNCENASVNAKKASLSRDRLSAPGPQRKAFR